LPLIAMPILTWFVPVPQAIMMKIAPVFIIKINGLDQPNPTV
jgi:hypothetical protein